MTKVDYLQNLFILRGWTIPLLKNRKIDIVNLFIYYNLVLDKMNQLAFSFDFTFFLLALF